MIGIGIDSGGSRTTYAIDDGSGTIQIGTECGSSISDSRDTQSVRMTLEWILDVIESQTDDEICVWIGAAGFAANTARSIGEVFSGPFKALGRRLEEDGRHCEAFIANDAVSLLKAPPLFGAGLVAIVGTGSVVMGAHPSFPNGVVQRGGQEWVVSDEGSGVWMTIQATRQLLKDIEVRGSQNYRSALLDRLADYLGISEADIADIPPSHRAFAKAGLVARRMAGSRPDTKRFLAQFVYPHIFDLASLEPGRPHDPIAAEVIDASTRVITDDVTAVSETLAAHTADDPNLREKLPLVVGGNIAANSVYDQRLRARVSSRCRFISSVTAVGDSADELATLALHYLNSSARDQRAIAKGFDPLNPVLKLL